MGGGGGGGEGLGIKGYIDKEIQLSRAYDRSTRCWPLLPGTGNAKVELLLDIQLE